MTDVTNNPSKIELLELYASLYLVRKLLIKERNTIHRRAFWKLINRFYKPHMIRKAGTMSVRIDALAKELADLRLKLIGE